MAVIPLVIGSYAFLFPPEITASREDKATHRWYIMVRHGGSANLTGIVSNVVFHLHPSFPNPIKSCSVTPFHISECGWGEFEVSIEVNFVPELGILPIKRNHILILNKPLSESQLTPAPPDSFSGMCCVNEKLCEIVVPKPNMILINRLQTLVPEVPNPLQQQYKIKSLNKDLEQISVARGRVAEEKERIMNLMTKMSEILSVHSESTTNQISIDPSLAP